MRSIKINKLTDLPEAVKILIDTPLMEAVHKFLQIPDTNQFYVVDANNKMIGILTRKRLFKKLHYQCLQPSSRISTLYKFATAETVEGIMLTHFPFVKPENNLNDVIKLMLENDFYEIPVIDTNGRLIGKLDTLYFLNSCLKSETKQS